MGRPPLRHRIDAARELFWEERLRTLIRRDEASRAAARARQLLDRKPHWAGVRAAYSWALIASDPMLAVREPQRYIAELDLTSRTAQGRHRLHVEAANALARVGAWEELRDCVRRYDALPANPAEEELLALPRGTLADVDGDYERALERYRVLLSSDLDDRWYLYLVLRALTQLDRTDEAAALLAAHDDVLSPGEAADIAARAGLGPQ